MFDEGRPRLPEGVLILRVPCLCRDCACVCAGEVIHLFLLQQIMLPYPMRVSLHTSPFSPTGQTPRNEHPTSKDTLILDSKLTDYGYVEVPRGYVRFIAHVLEQLSTCL